MHHLGLYQIKTSTELRMLCNISNNYILVKYYWLGFQLEIFFNCYFLPTGEKNKFLLAKN